MGTRTFMKADILNSWRKLVLPVLLVMVFAVGICSARDYSAHAEVTPRSGTDGSLSWSIDSSGHLTVTGTGDYRGSYTTTIGGVSYATPAWNEFGGSITSAKIEVTGITNTSCMFANCSNMESIDLSGLNTSLVTNMLGMFYGCTSLKTLDLKNMNTGKCQDMCYMFWGCSTLTKLDLSKFDMGMVQSFYKNWSHDPHYTSTDGLTVYDTSYGYNYYVQSFTNQELAYVWDSYPSFTYTSVSHTSSMLAGCTSLKTIIIPANSRGPIAFPNGVYKSILKGKYFTYAAPEQNVADTYTLSESLGSIIATDSKYMPLYTDVDYTIEADDISLLANSSKNNPNNSVTLFTKVTPSYTFSVAKGGKIDSALGKVAVGVTLSDEKPTVIGGKIVDADASYIATATIKGGAITVTANSQPGTVYLWVIDTGCFGYYSCCEISVCAAAKKIQLTKWNMQEGSISDEPEMISGLSLFVGDTDTIAIYPTYTRDGQEILLSEGNYSYTMDERTRASFEVVKDSDTEFIIRCKGLKNNKVTKGKITFFCEESGAKAILSVTASNPVDTVDVTLGKSKYFMLEEEATPSPSPAPDASPSPTPEVAPIGEEAGAAGAVSPAEISILAEPQAKAKIGVTLKIAYICKGTSKVTSDAVKLYALASPDGFTIDEEKNKVTVTDKLKNSPIKAKLDSGKKSISLSVSNGADWDEQAYFLLYYNPDAYKIISVKTVYSLSGETPPEKETPSPAPEEETPSPTPDATP